MIKRSKKPVPLDKLVDYTLFSIKNNYESLSNSYGIAQIKLKLAQTSFQNIKTQTMNSAMLLLLCESYMNKKMCPLTYELLKIAKFIKLEEMPYYEHLTLAMVMKLLKIKHNGVFDSIASKENILKPQIAPEVLVDLVEGRGMLYKENVQGMLDQHTLVTYRHNRAHQVFKYIPESELHSSGRLGNLATIRDDFYKLREGFVKVMVYC